MADSSSTPAVHTPVDLDRINVILATDCGSTTTKAILIEKVDGEFRQTFRGEAPTTVEEPAADVTMGVPVKDYGCHRRSPHAQRERIWVCVHQGVKPSLTSNCVAPENTSCALKWKPRNW